MLDDLLQRRPYNAVADFDRCPGRARAWRQNRFHRCRSFAQLRRAASALLAVRAALSDARTAAGRAARHCSCHDTVDFPVAFWGGVRAGIVSAAAQHAAHCRAIRLHPR